MKKMKKVFTLLTLAMMALGLASCSSDDNDNAPVTPAQLFGNWSLVNDHDRTITTTLTFSNERFINYSVTNTAINPTIPANCPTYTRLIIVDPSVTDPYATQKEYTKEEGYFTILGSQLTLWPQVNRTSTDGTVYTETAVADLPSMEVYTFSLNNANVMVLTKGDGTRQTFTR